MNDKILLKINENPELKKDKLFCQNLAAAFHTFYIEGENFEIQLIRIIGKSKLDEKLILMPKQIEMLNNIKKEKYCVLSAPTSFGKSFIVLEYLKRLEEKQRLIVYVVHTKSLCDEVLNNFNKYFSEDYNIIDDFVYYDESLFNIVVIISDGKNLFDFNKDIDILIVDECYNLDKSHSNDRFLTIYRAYKLLMNNAKRIILLGPFINELKGSEAEKYKLFKTNYSPVTALIYEGEALTFDNPSNEFIDKIKKNENTIGFINSKSTIYSEMNNLYIGNDLTDLYYDPFIQWMENYFPDFWLLPKLMKKGIAVYHSAFPKYINLYNLKKFNDGIFRGLLTTSAILEGVNTSAKNIVVYSTTNNNSSLTPFQFYNLCGRAGRLNREIVGYIYNYGDGYVEQYNKRCLPLYIGDNPQNAEDKFDEDIMDDESVTIKEVVKNKLAIIGIDFEKWYDEYKYYFGSCRTLLNLIDVYLKFREKFKLAMTGELLNKNKTSLNKNSLVDYIYSNFIKLTDYKYIPHSKYSVDIVLKVLLMSRNNGVDFNLKNICYESQIYKKINEFETVEEKNQYIVEIMRTGYEYIPYKLFYVSTILNQFIKYDSYFEDKEKSYYENLYFNRINIYLKNDEDNLLLQIMNNKGLIPPLISKVLDYIKGNGINVNEMSKKDLMALIKNIIFNKIELDESEKINLQNIKL